MAKTKTIVVQSDTVGPDDSITAPQMKDFWRMVSDGTINRRRLQGFLGNPAKFEPETVTIARAANILGIERVLTADRVSHLWGITSPSVAESVAIHFTEDDLRQTAAENQSGAEWRLVFYSGQSLREQHAKRGDDPQNQPCFYKEWSWWLKAEENKWATEKPKPGYYLIDFRGWFGRTSWNRQSEKIAKLSPDFERTHEAVISETAMSFFMATGERLLKNFYHWGRSLTSNGFRVYVGDFGERGFEVYGYAPGWGDYDSLRVCLSRKFRN